MVGARVEKLMPEQLRASHQSFVDAAAALTAPSFVGKWKSKVRAPPKFYDCCCFFFETEVLKFLFEIVSSCFFVSSEKKKGCSWVQGRPVRDSSFHFEEFGAGWTMFVWRARVSLIPCFLVQGEPTFSALIEPLCECTIWTDETGVISKTEGSPSLLFGCSGEELLHTSIFNLLQSSSDWRLSSSSAGKVVSTMTL
jgi:hypothetical protein